VLRRTRITNKQRVAGNLSITANTTEPCDFASVHRGARIATTFPAFGFGAHRTEHRHGVGVVVLEQVRVDI
jgi:uncharacterized protein (DUF3084 family)